MLRNNKYLTFIKCVAIILCVSMIGCAPVISRQIREQVKPNITAGDVLKNPENYKGETVILSGVIIDSENTKEGTLLKVLQRPSGFREKPKDVDTSEGRFLAFVDHYLDISVYAKDRAVTLGGTIQGIRTLPLGEIQYNYPLISVKEIHLWPVEKSYDSANPSFHIGVGFFHGW